MPNAENICLKNFLYIAKPKLRRQKIKLQNIHTCFDEDEIIIKYASFGGNFVRIRPTDEKFLKRNT